MEDEYYSDEIMQDYDDSFLNDEHPLYAEINPDGQESDGLSSDVNTIDQQPPTKQTRTGRNTSLQDKEGQLQGCFSLIITVIIFLIVYIISR